MRVFENDPDAGHRQKLHSYTHPSLSFFYVMRRVFWQRINTQIGGLYMKFCGESESEVKTMDLWLPSDFVSVFIKNMKICCFWRRDWLFWPFVGMSRSEKI